MANLDLFTLTFIHKTVAYRILAITTDLKGNLPNVTTSLTISVSRYTSLRLFYKIRRNIVLVTNILSESVISFQLGIQIKELYSSRPYSY